jgi:dihydrofolate reductase
VIGADSSGCRFGRRSFVAQAKVKLEKEEVMGKVVVTEFVSLDGVMEAPGGGEEYRHGGWTFEVARGEEGDKFKLDELIEAEAQLLGRVTYQGFAAAWPKMADEAGFAEKMNTMPKYVVSSTLDQAEWSNSTVLDGDVATEVEKLKREVDGVILVAGSAQLVQALLEHDLVDELRLMVFPVILGSGKRLFGASADKLSLQLADSKTVGDGIAILTYKRA